MIVYDLKCGAQHVFEAWFGSSSDYESQRERGLIACPLCDSPEVERLPSRLAIGGMAAAGAHAEESPSTGPGSGSGNVRQRHDSEQPLPPPSADQPSFDAEKAKKALTAMAKAQAEAVAKSDYVGGKFAEEARAMYYGEQAARPIYGETDRKEARALYEEGVPAMPLLFPVKRRSDA
ncbi:DUF1178 family protein [Pacificimonas sp. ICDLI1SI03]